MLFSEKDYLESLFLCVAIFAKYWSAFCRLEWNFAFVVTFRASCFVHFTWTKITSESAASATSVAEISHVLFSSYAETRRNRLKSPIVFF